MSGKTIISKSIGNKFWDEDMKMKNSRGKKHAMAKAEAKMGSRKFRHDKSYLNEI